MELTFGHIVLLVFCLAMGISYIVNSGKLDSSIYEFKNDIEKQNENISRELKNIRNSVEIIHTNTDKEFDKKVDEAYYEGIRFALLTLATYGDTVYDSDSYYEYLHDMSKLENFHYQGALTSLTNNATERELEEITKLRRKK